MQTSERDIKFIGLFTGMCEVFGKSYSETLLDVYSGVLSRYPISDVEKAIKQAIVTCRFFPKPVDLIEAIENNSPKQLENKAHVLANEIIQHLKAYGKTKFPSFLESDPVALKLMQRRWPYRQWASEVLDSELTWWVKEFVAEYQAYKDDGTGGAIEAPAGFLKLAEGVTKEIL